MDFINEHDIIILTETWLSNSTCYNLNIAGYSAEHQHGNKSQNTRKGRHSGGISIYYRNSLMDKITIAEKQQCGIVWLKSCRTLFHFNTDVFLCCSYIPPRGSQVLNTINDNIFEQIEIGIEKYKLLGKTLVTGDLNCRTSNEIDFINYDKFLDNNDITPNVFICERVNKDHVLDSHGARLIELCKTTGLQIANGRLHADKSVGEYTYMSHNGMSVVDYLLACNNDFQYISAFEIMPPSSCSDHNAVYFCVERLCPVSVPHNFDSHEDIYLEWDDSKINIFREYLSNNTERLTRLTDNVHNATVDESIHCFTVFMQENAFKVFGKKRKTYYSESSFGFKKKWFNNECFSAKKEFNKARNTFLRNRNEENKALFIKQRKLYNCVKRKYKTVYKRAEGIRVSRLAKDNPKSFWRNVKAQYKNNSVKTCNITIDDMYEHFNTLYGPSPSPNSDNADNNADIVYDNELNSEFTAAEIRKAVFSQNNSKSPGTDNLISEVFKHSFDIISPFLTRFYNKIFNEGVFPEEWSEGIIIPIFKGGIYEAKNFRGITLNNILSKIYSKLLVERLIKWADTKDTFIDNQYGFQKNKSTVDCIFVLHAIISKTLASKKKLYVAYLDWDKMFDSIDRALLWRKLLIEDISTKFIKAIKSMYNVVKSTVRYKNFKSDPISSKIGVKQGDPASSILCLFF